MRLDTLASILEASYEGDAACEVHSIAAIENAGPEHLTFVSSEQYGKYLASTNAGIVVLAESEADGYQGNKILVANPYLAYAKLSAVFAVRVSQCSGIHPSATIAEGATVGKQVSIGANCVVAAGASIGAHSEIYPGCYIGENAHVGENALLHANVTIYQGVRIGKNAIIHSGAVIGSDGFGFAPAGGKWIKIHQLGGVCIGDNVEIGANTAIDRGALEDTIIEEDVIIDNQVHIAHNVKVGKGTAIAGCVGIAGSAIIGKNCTIAGAVAINGHIEIADNSHFHGGTIVTRGNSESGQFASTTPLMSVKEWRKNAVRYRQLDEWVQRIKELEKTQKNN